MSEPRENCIDTCLPEQEQPERMKLNRRTFIAASAYLAVATARAQRASIPIIDTHLHFYDTTRPQGWANLNRQSGPLQNARFMPIANPETFRKVAVPLGVVGAIETEASPGSRTICGFWRLRRRTPSWWELSEIFSPKSPSFASTWLDTTRIPCFAGFDTGTSGGEVW